MSSAIPREDYYASDDGLRLYFRDYGAPVGVDRTPLLCLPGLTRNSRDFEEFAAIMAPTRRVITTDLRGRGNSQHDPDRGNYHPARYVADVWCLLAHLSLSRVIVVGTSLGGLIAMSMASERPQCLQGIVLNDVGPELDPVGLARVAASAGELPVVADWDAAAAAVREATSVAFPDWSDQRWLAFARKLYEPTGDGRLDVRMDRNIGVAMREGRSGLPQDPWALFAALRAIPVLVVHGVQSDILTVPILEKMQQAKPDLQIASVANRGHAPNLDEPEAVRAIERFLAAL
jgi:pimeloyl-ACP methyl ester carboxylesterase